MPTSEPVTVVSPQQAMMLIGELYIENRVLREQLAAAQAELATLKKPAEGAAP